MRRLSWIVLMLLLVVGCSAERVTPDVLTNKPEITEEASDTAIPVLATETAIPFVPLRSPTPHPNPSPTARANLPLSPEGPWLLVVGTPYAPIDLWGINADGTLPTRITPYNVGSLEVNPVNPSLVAFTYEQPLDNIYLNIIELPNTTPVFSMPLLSPSYAEKQYEDFEEYKQYDQHMTGKWVTHWANLAWSPDGKQLAFVAIPDDSTTADLFTYSIETGSITRLSDEPSHADYPEWSPDGRFVVYTGINRKLSIMEFDALWKAHTDGTGAEPLYPITNTDPNLQVTPEGIIGWDAPDTFLVITSHAPGRGRTDLRAVNIETGVVEPLWDSSPIWSVAFNPITKTIAVGISEFLGADLPFGLYLRKFGELSWRKLSDELTLEMRWSVHENQFIAALTNYRYVSITTDGEIADYHDPVIDLFPDLFQSVDPSSVSSEWSSDGQHVVFRIGQKAVYVANAPDFTLIPLDPQIKSDYWYVRWIAP